VYQVTRWLPRYPAGFDHLLRQPRRIGMSRDPRMYEFTTTVMNDEEYVQCLKPDGLSRKQIARPDLVAMLSQKLSPTGRGRSTIGCVASHYYQYHDPDKVFAPFRHATKKNSPPAFA